MTTEFRFLQEEKPRPQNKPVAKWRIDGETLNLAEIAERIHTTENIASQRLHKLRHASGRVTIERLKAFGERRGGRKQKAA